MALHSPRATAEVEGQRRFSKSASRGADPTCVSSSCGGDGGQNSQIELEGTSVAQERPRVRQRVSGTAGVGFIPPMPTLVPGELFTWLEDRQTDLQEALSSGDTSHVLELTSKMSEGAEHLREITSSVRMVP